MKNINVDVENNDFSLEEIIDKNELPISINNDFVVLDYDEYINMLKLVNPEKAILLENEIKSKIN